MSNLLIKLMSRSGLLKHAIAGVSLAASLAAHAATVDAAVSLSGNAAVQAENLMNAQVGFAPVPLSDAEADSVDAERFRLRVKVFGVQVGGPISMGSKYRWPHFDGTLNCIVVPAANGVAPRCTLSN